MYNITSGLNQKTINVSRETERYNLESLGRPKLGRSTNKELVVGGEEFLEEDEGSDENKCTLRKI